MYFLLCSCLRRYVCIKWMILDQSRCNRYSYISLYKNRTPSQTRYELRCEFESSCVFLERESVCAAWYRYFICSFEFVCYQSILNMARNISCDSLSLCHSLIFTIFLSDVIDIIRIQDVRTLSRNNHRFNSSLLLCL